MAKQLFKAPNALSGTSGPQSTGIRQFSTSQPFGVFASDANSFGPQQQPFVAPSQPFGIYQSDANPVYGAANAPGAITPSPFGEGSLTADTVVSAATNIADDAAAGSVIPVVGTVIGAGLGLISTIMQYNAAKRQIEENKKAQAQQLSIYNREIAKADKRYAEETAYSHKMDKRNMKLQDENIKYQKMMQFSANLKDFFNRKPEALSRLMQIQQFEGA